MNPQGFYAPLGDVVKRKILFVSGKGGVGKTVVSQAIAASLAEKGQRTLWVTFDDPFHEAGTTLQKAPNLWHTNVSTSTAFEEYMTKKIRVAALARMFVHNALIQYITQAAPGVHELVLLGKVWWERLNYDHVIVDMPSTGHGLAMFKSTENFAKLFRGGAARADADAMIETFGNPAESGTLVVAIPEEMPLRESLELTEVWHQLFPKNPPAYLVNRCFPDLKLPQEIPDEWQSPMPASAEDYLKKRSILEKYNLQIWDELKIPYVSIGFSTRKDHSSIVQNVSMMLKESIQ